MLVLVLPYYVLAHATNNNAFSALVETQQEIKINYNTPGIDSFLS
ncbi:MAG: hypothetical protein ACI90V_012361 [Bacillariaceae sp.]|jgi:hypothetical protein